MSRPRAFSFVTAVSNHQNTDLQSIPTAAYRAVLGRSSHWPQCGGGPRGGRINSKISIATARPDQLVVNWRNVHYYSGSSTSANGITFEAVLQLNTGASRDKWCSIMSIWTMDRESAARTVRISAPARRSASKIPAQRPIRSCRRLTTLPRPVQGTAIRYFRNSPPVANANGPYTVAPGGTVQLSSAGSSDPRWRLVDLHLGPRRRRRLRRTGPAPPTATRPAPRRSTRGGLFERPPYGDPACRRSDGAFSDSTATVTVTGALPCGQRRRECRDRQHRRQRSLVTTLTVTFDSVVSFAGPWRVHSRSSRTGGGVGPLHGALQRHRRRHRRHARHVHRRGHGPRLLRAADGRYTLTALTRKSRPTASNSTATATARRATISPLATPRASTASSATSTGSAGRCRRPDAIRRHVRRVVRSVRLQRRL